MARLSLTQLQNAVDTYNEYFNALRTCFVGREHVIEVLRYAMAQRQHVLIVGPPGTSKTAISDVAFAGITDSEKFHVELSMFMGEDAIFGPYDVKKMREEGKLEHRIEGMLPTANVARIGEVLDGNMPLLRTLLSALHERRMRRGTQVIDMPLMTVYCDTNIDSGEFLKRHPYAWAVLDRILFITSLGYLINPTDVAEMVLRFQSGRTTKLGKNIPLSLIHDISEHIIRPPSLITDQLVFVKFGEACQEYRNKRTEEVKSGRWKVVLPEISDRRICLASQMLEASAVLSGRLEVLPEDLLPVYHALGTTSEEQHLWEEIAKRKIKEIEKERSQQLDHAQKVAIESILREAKQIDSNGDVQKAAGSLQVLSTQLKGVVPADQNVEALKREAERTLNSIREKLSRRLLEQAGLAN